MKFCRHCGHQISDDAVFCRNCGKQQTQDVPKDEPSPIPDSVAAPANTPAPASKPVEAPQKPRSFSRPVEPVQTAQTQKNSKLPLIIAVVVLALVGGYAFMAFWPGLHTNTPPVNASTADSSNSTAAATNASVPSNNTAPSNASSNQAPAASNQAADTSNQAPATPTVPAASTDKRPTFDEFDWYYNLPRLDVIPSNGKPLKDFQATSGGWKAMLLYDAMGEEGVPSRELLNISINGTEKDFTVIIDPYQAQYGQELEDETKIEDTVLNGKWNGTDNTLTATKGKKLSLAVTAFYTNKNTQYALGRLTFDGGGATLLMMRP